MEFLDVFTSLPFWIGAVVINILIETIKKIIKLNPALLKASQKQWFKSLIIAPLNIILGALLGLIPGFLPGTIITRVFIGIIAGSLNSTIYSIFNKILEKRFKGEDKDEPPNN